MLPESLHADLRVMSSLNYREIGGDAKVIRRTVLFRDAGKIRLPAFIDDRFAFSIALEPRPGYHVEHSVCAVSVLRRITATLNFNEINVLGIELRAHVAGNVGIRNRHPIQQPSDLMPAANVKLIMY